MCINGCFIFSNLKGWTELTHVTLGSVIKYWLILLSAIVHLPKEKWCKKEDWCTFASIQCIYHSEKNFLKRNILTIWPNYCVVVKRRKIWKKNIRSVVKDKMIPPQRQTLRIPRVIVGSWMTPRLALAGPHQKKWGWYFHHLSIVELGGSRHCFLV